MKGSLVSDTSPSSTVITELSAGCWAAAVETKAKSAMDDRAQMRQFWIMETSLKLNARPFVSARHARPCAGHPRLVCAKNVDGRDKPGHDAEHEFHLANSAFFSVL